MIQTKYLKIIYENGAVTHGGNQSLFSKQVRKSGCGMIAALDYAIFLKANGDLTIPIAEYREKEAIAEFWFYKNCKNLFGISRKKITKYLSQTLGGREFIFVPKRKLVKEKFVNLVQKCVQNNTPIIIRIGENFKTLPYTISFNDKSYNGKMRWHYITAIDIDSEKITFCSWGGVGEMKITDLLRYFGFTGGIILPSDMYNTNQKITT